MTLQKEELERIRPVTEKKLEAYVVEALEGLGAWIMPKTHMSTRGIPDRLVCYKGHFIAIEFKGSKGGVKSDKGRVVLQRKTLQDIADSCGVAYFVYPENAYEFLNYVRSLDYVTRPQIPSDPV